MTDKSSYRRLRGSAFLNSNRLYTGSDHLLSSTSHWFTEEYLRFYYSDIQAILTRKTIRGKVLNSCFLVMLVIFLLPSFLLSGGWAAFFLILAFLSIILLVVNLIKGPTSICHIQTPVQTARLEAIRRLNGAEKAIAQIKTYIERSQGLLTQEDFQNVEPKERFKASYKKSDITRIHEDGNYHKALFSILAASTIFIAMELFFPGIISSIFSGAINLTIGAIFVISLRKQSRSDLNGSIKTITWSICGYLVLRYFFSYIIYMTILFQNPDIVYNQWELFKKTAITPPLEHTWMLVFYALFIVFTAGIGLLGVILTVMFQKEYKTKKEYLNDEEQVDMGLEHE
ncbi:MAG: hypothetical protein PVG39_07790 [Desulfobacteraceae bacterium]